MANETGKALASTDPWDSICLLARMISAFSPNPLRPNLGLVVGLWITRQARRHPANGVILNFVLTKFLLVTGRGLSRHILDQTPSADSYSAGPSKIGGVSFLAKKSLTIGHDEKWRKLRPLNEQTVSTGDGPDLQQATLDQVNQEFADPITRIDDIRDRMGKVMLGVVFGGGASTCPTE